MSVFKIHDEDFDLIKELLLHIDAKEVAVKWEVAPETVSVFLKRHGTSAHRIRKEHRKAFISKNFKSMNRGEMSDELNIHVSILGKLIAEMTAKELNGDITC